MIRRILFYSLVVTAPVVSCAQSAATASTDNYLTYLLDRNKLLFDTLRLEADRETVNEDDAWKSWRTVDNFMFGKDRGSLPMIADLNSLHPYFRDQIVSLMNTCRRHGIELEVVESFRTRAKQSEYFGMGKKYTRSAGGKSKHQYGLAVDIVAIVNGVPQWDNEHLWKKIGVMGEKLGLRWGGRWRAPYDPAHFEWAGPTSAYQLAGGLQPLLPKSKLALYPCLDEQIQQLQRAYTSWEIEQASIARTTPRKSKLVAGSVGQ